MSNIEIGKIYYLVKPHPCVSVYLSGGKEYAANVGDLFLCVKQMVSTSAGFPLFCFYDLTRGNFCAWIVDTATEFFAEER